MQEIIIDIMNNYGYFGIAFLVAFENIFPPIPSEIILTFGGFMTTYSKMGIVGVVIAATIGSIIGAIVLYLFGRIFTKERLGKIVDSKIGRILRFKKSDIYKAEDWFTKKGKLTVLFCRFIPIVRSLISIPAGMTKMSFPLFIIYTTIASLIWNIALVCLGALAGNKWMDVVDFIDKYSKVCLIIICILIVVGIILFYKNRKNKKHSTAK